MMGRGPFYTPFHSMWGGAFGAGSAATASNTTTTTSTKHNPYSTSTSGANFGYPPTPPKDGTPDNHQINQVTIYAIWSS
jgi:hypothetical protein